MVNAGVVTGAIALLISLVAFGLVIYLLVNPKTKNGDTGPQGPQGPAGENGQSGLEETFFYAIGATTKIPVKGLMQWTPINLSSPSLFSNGSYVAPNDGTYLINVNILASSNGNIFGSPVKGIDKYFGNGKVTDYSFFIPGNTNNPVSFSCLLNLKKNDPVFIELASPSPIELPNPTVPVGNDNEIICNGATMSIYQVA